MKQSILIADSGGTRTDWCFIDQDKKRHFFTTSSFHPVKWNDAFFKEFYAFWEDKPEMREAKVHFYGAGCMDESNKVRLADYFNKWQFGNVTILSDVEAACHATIGNEKGNIAILGTGSIFCTYDGEKIHSLYGGLGYLIGDEGSGYYFGKMFLSEFLNGSFDANTTQLISEKLGDRAEVLKNVYGENSKDYISSMSFVASELKSITAQVRRIHEENITVFVEKFVKKNVNPGSTISFVGSYAFYNQDILSEILKKYNYSLKETLQFPIDSLTDYIEKKTF